MSKENRDDVGEVMSYLRAMSAVSAGVRFEHNTFGNIEAGTDVIELRIAVNACLVMCDAIRDVLIAKGVVMAEEFERALDLAATREVRRYEKKISERVGREIKLDSLFYK